MLQEIHAAKIQDIHRVRPVSPWERLFEWRRNHNDFWALRDISFQVARGEALG